MLKDKKLKSKTRLRSEIYNLLNSKATLLSKRPLIDKFITEQLPNIADTDIIAASFVGFWAAEHQKTFNDFVASENLHPNKAQ